jgi:cytochrome c biogenesis protein CcmG, thiol:disulfide interchange protein DsbE
MSKKRLMLILGAVVVVGGAFGFLMWTRVPSAAEIGERTPKFDLPLVAGGTTNLGDYRGRVTVINFWATWCPPCVEEAPSLEKFATEVRPQGVEVLGVSVDQDTAALQKFIAEQHVTYPIARDPLQTLAWRYGTYKYPETYILDRGGRLAEKIIGPMDWTDPRMIEFVRELANPSQSNNASSTKRVTAFPKLSQ